MSNTHNAIIYNGEEYGGGSGGHGIIDAEGNEIPYEKDLQFGTGFDVVDDSENGKTIIELDANAVNVSFDNTGTDLESTNAEDAIKEVNAKVGDTDISSIGDGTATGAISELNSNLSNKLTFDTQWISNVDVNTLGMGIYFVGVGCSNLPLSNIEYGVLISIYNGSNTAFQMFNGNDNALYYRRMQSTVWASWQKVTTY